jgi:hypothetical protein
MAESPEKEKTRTETFTGERQAVFYRAGHGDQIQIGIANSRRSRMASVPSQSP